MSSARAPLAVRFADHVRARGRLSGDDVVVVALSGGLDSVVLLHLMRFLPGGPRPRLVAAHVDHAMRPDSAADAAWVRGLATSWGVEVHSTRLDPAPSGEAEARRRRYAYLEEVRAAAGGTLVVTAHHADDQAETVLFRVLRGAGIAGLQGIRERRKPALWRPLLPFGRDELLAYARQVDLSWREDPTNRDPYARNVLRNRILPEAEASVAPGARRSLVRLARRAREEQVAWRSLVPGLLEGVDLRVEESGLSVDRSALLVHHPAVRSRLLRALARRLGVTPRAAGTRLAVEFTSSGESGGEVPLGRGMVLRRELDRLVLARRAPTGPDLPVLIPGPETGEATLKVGGAAYRVLWSREKSPERGWCEGFSIVGVRFPVTVRTWAPGDRVRMPYGSKKLKKLFLEARVPPGRRHRVPVVADAAGRILWVPEVVRSVDALPEEDADVLYIGITHADSD